MCVLVIGEPLSLVIFLSPCGCSSYLSSVNALCISWCVEDKKTCLHWKKGVTSVLYCVSSCWANFSSCNCLSFPCGVAAVVVAVVEIITLYQVQTGRI